MRDEPKLSLYPVFEQGCGQLHTLYTTRRIHEKVSLSGQGWGGGCEEVMLPSDRHGYSQPGRHEDYRRLCSVAIVCCEKNSSVTANNTRRLVESELVYLSRAQNGTCDDSTSIGWNDVFVHNELSIVLGNVFDARICSCGHRAPGGVVVVLDTHISKPDVPGLQTISTRYFLHPFLQHLFSFDVRLFKYDIAPF